MGVSGRDLLLVAPELALTVLATLVVLADLLFRGRRWVPALAVVGLAAPLIASAGLWNEVRANGPETAFGGSLVVDEFALFFKFLIVGIVGLILVAGTEYARRFSPYQAEYAGLVLFSAAGLMLLAAAADLITVYVALELATLPIVALAAFTKTQVRSAEAAVKYLVLSAVSSAILVYGFAFLYGATGTVRLLGDGPTIAQVVASGDARLPFGGFAIMAGAVLATAGFGFKLSMVPFQMWTPDVYEGAPTPVAAFPRHGEQGPRRSPSCCDCSTQRSATSPPTGPALFAALAAVTMTVGNAVAIVQTNVKRLLGYSAIAHAGYALIGVAAIAARSPEVR